MSALSGITMATLVGERVAMVRYIDTLCGQIAEAAKAGRIDAAEAALRIEQARTIASGLATGLHTGSDTPELRAAVREDLREAGLSGRGFGR